MQIISNPINVRKPNLALAQLRTNLKAKAEVEFKEALDNKDIQDEVDEKKKFRNQIIIIAVITAVVGVGLFLFFKSRKK